jgi:hypothetical protein
MNELNERRMRAWRHPDEVILDIKVYELDRVPKMAQTRLSLILAMEVEGSGPSEDR